jgi:hypothetical protein
VRIRYYEIRSGIMLKLKGKNGKDIPVTGRGGPQVCERSRLPHYLDRRLTDGGKVVSPTRPPHFTPRFPVIIQFGNFFLLIKIRND